MGKKVFSGCHFCITGKLSQLRKLVVNHIESNGGVVHSSVTSDVGYLICSESDIGTSKYMTAQGFGVKLIKEQYLYDCVAKGKLLDTAKYDIEGDGSGGSDDDDADPPAKAAPKKASKLKAWDNPPAPAAKKAKKNASEDEDGDDDDGDDAMDASEEESEDDSDDRPVCSFGATCYRKNPQHFIDESHPKDHASYVAPPKKPKAPKAPKPKTAPTAKAAATAKTAPPAVTKTASSAVKVLASADLLGEIQQHLPNKDVLNLALTNTDVASLVASALKTRQADFELGEPLRHLKAKEYAQDVLSLNTSEDVFLKGDIIKMDDERYEVLQAPEDGGWKLKNLSTGKITKAKEDDDDFSDKMYSADLEESKPANAMQEKHRNKLPVEIWYTDNGVYFHDELQQLVNALAESKAPDWHPGSKEIVNDLVHPALYALKLPKAPQGEDFWRRPFDNSVHQWLPSEIDVDKFGRVRFASYINNMPPGQEHLTVVLERLLELLIPSWEHAWQYCRTYMQGNTADGDMQEEYQDEELVSFRGRRLQVVPKIVEFVLKPGQTYEGVWHYEGMSHENVVATGLYYLRRDDGIEGGQLEFKRNFSDVEACTLTFEMGQQRPRGCEQLTKDFVPLGTLETSHKRLLTFINCHAHRILPMTNVSDKVLKRQFVCFFLVNPDIRIKSTQDVKPQQGVISQQEALKRRLELLEERKYYKQTLNPREVELCEH